MLVQEKLYTCLALVFSVVKNHPCRLMQRVLTLSSFDLSLTSTTRASSETLRGIYAAPETEVSSCLVCTVFIVCFSCCCFLG